ncbi:hypothetical protein GCM10027435_06330 [Haloparvum alkalitolerans]|uniref:molybdopterin-dependent oxidoreductase n=1 Tax=Haloparvum alkalitolerans TaxID=1042953 RepID=UPI003CF6A16A
MDRLSAPAESLARRAAVLALAFGASGAAAVAGSFVVAGDGPAFLVTAVASTLLYLLPDALVTWGILTLGEYGRPLLAVAAAVGTVALFAALVAGVVRLAGQLNRSRADALFGAFLVQTVAAFALTVRPLAALAAGAAGGVTLAVAGRAVTDPDARTVPDRRAVLRAVGAAGAAAGIGWLVAPRAADLPDETVEDEGVLALLEAADERSLGVPGIDPLVSDGFYQVDINTSTPVVDREAWELTVSGGPTEFAVDYDELTDREGEHRFVTLRCVSDELNGRTMDTALWTGIPVADLLAEADAPEECCVRIEAHDGYYQGFPRAALERGFLAWRMNGELLPRGHGHPVRLLIPGHWGEINVKWVTGIEVRDEEVTGYWEERGWHGTGPVETVAKIHAVEPRGDGTVLVGGHAYAGTRGVDRVEVSTDGGETWTDATLSDRLPGAAPADGEARVEGVAADAWRMWRHEYEADEPHEVVARAVEPDGTVQPAEESDAFPSGATGWVRRTVEP